MQLRGCWFRQCNSDTEQTPQQSKNHFLLEASVQPSIMKFDIPNFKGPPQERRRVEYVLAMLHGCTPEIRKQAQRDTDTKPRQHAQIIRLLEDQGSFSDRPRSGRPPLYTEEVMDKAYKFLVDYDEGYLTGASLHQKLIERGDLWPEADVDTFLQKLKGHVRSKGHSLVINSTKTTFFLAIEDVVKRVQFASQMQQQLETVDLDMTIYTDETTEEESPHPKGMTECKDKQHCPESMHVCTLLYVNVLHAMFEDMSVNT